MTKGVTTLPRGLPLGLLLPKLELTARNGTVPRQSISNHRLWTHQPALRLDLGSSTRLDPTDPPPQLQNGQGRRVGRQGIPYHQDVAEEGFVSPRVKGRSLEQREHRQK